MNHNSTRTWRIVSLCLCVVILFVIASLFMMPQHWYAVVTNPVDRNLVLRACFRFETMPYLAAHQRLLYRYTIVTASRPGERIVMFLPRERYSKREDDDRKSAAIEVQVVFNAKTLSFERYRIAAD